MDLARLTDAEVAHLCANVTPEQREFCRTHMNVAEWPEIWLRDNVSKDPAEDLTAGEAYTAAQWWEFMCERVVHATAQ